MHLPVPPRSSHHEGREEHPVRRSSPHVLIIPLVAVTLIAAVALPPAAPARGAVELAPAVDLREDEPVVHQLPVAAAVSRPFEPPVGAYGPGHRGVDLAAPAGVGVHATERGTVHHAGPVAGTVWVSIDHPDGVRTSYGPLSGVRVVRGELVERGQRIGTLADTHHGDAQRDTGLHLGARRDGEYIDPMSLPGIAVPRPTLVGDGGWWGTDHAVTPYAAWGGGRLGGVLTSPSPEATAPGFAVPPNANHLVLVAGLGTSSRQSILDATHLGIDPSSTTHLSYAGRDLAWDGADRGVRRDQLPYGPQDTWRGVEEAALHLREQLEELARREPGRAVDLVGHSMGGVVITYYLLHLHDPYDRSLPAISHVVTIASPLEGSDLARAGTALLAHPAAGAAVRHGWSAVVDSGSGLGQLAGGLHPDAPAIRELATGSTLLADLERAWQEALLAGSAGPLAMGTRILSIAGSLDAVVGADRAALPGVDERRVLPGGHEGVLSSEAVREVTWRFLADQEVVASPGYLSTGTSALYGAGLTLLGAGLGDVGGLRELGSDLARWQLPG